MRLNKFVAQASGHSRRQADELISAGRITVNGLPARLGQSLAETDSVALDGQALSQPMLVYLLLHKPAGYVTSRSGQGAPTVYELLPAEYRLLNSVGRLDKDTSGLLLFSNDGDWAQSLTHPRHAKAKIYEVELDRDLSDEDRQGLERGVKLEDGLSRLEFIASADPRHHTIRLRTGRNRQIRRTFSALNRGIVRLHRTEFGPYRLNGLKSGQFKEVEKPDV